ncbi:Mov34/MPN/PAD-1 family protein [bacterium]|nr:Mov34/MPN/PAD-1 family protein [bacterium]
MDNFWVEKAQKYIQDHNAFKGVSIISYSETPENAIISATVSIGLPSKFIKEGITDIGVKSIEEVRFVFPDQFPLKAPKILLRNDFPRCFPHINPLKFDVNPCICDGDLSELLQQSEWMNGILNQLVDWLEKAASNELLNYDQGWEPMRNDHCSGFMLYDLNEVITAYNSKNSLCLTKEIYFEERKGIIVTDALCDSKKKKTAHAVYCMSPFIIKTYIPNSITTLSNLYRYASSIEISDLKEHVEEIDLEHLNEDKLFVVLSVKRPVKLIGSDCNIEFLNFVIHKSKPRKKNKKRVLPDCKAGMLSHIEELSPALLKRLSGTETKLNETQKIALVGCGSLGSKIGMNLARNGNGPFLCIDDDIFMPHNNARHALTLTWAQNKAELLSLSMFNTSKVLAEAVKGSAFSADFSNSRLIIDTTASLAVKHFLMDQQNLPPIISGGLFGQGRCGILFIENNLKTSRLTDLWAYLYHYSLEKNYIHDVLFTSQRNQAQIGQSCSSQTLIVDDARISLMAAIMSLKIQQIVEKGLPKNGEIMLSKYDDNYSLITEILSVPDSVPVPSPKKRDWQVFLFETVIEQMKESMSKKSPNETGGVLLGTVFLHAKSVVVTAILPAPPDSIEKPYLFVLGTEGLEEQIKSIEKKTNGKVTYLGTWHSHPHGGNASDTDDNTYNKLLFVRNYEPTVCLIVTPQDVLQV